MLVMPGSAGASSAFFRPLPAALALVVLRLGVRLAAGFFSLLVTVAGCACWAAGAGSAGGASSCTKVTFLALRSRPSVRHPAAIQARAWAWLSLLAHQARWFRALLGRGKPRIFSIWLKVNSRRGCPFEPRCSTRV